MLYKLCHYYELCCTVRTEGNVHMNNYNLLVLLYENLVRPDKVSLVP